MKMLTKNTDYAIRALLLLSLAKDNFLPASQIAKKEKIPYQFLRRILQHLIKHKLVVSREGIKGGFKINVSPDSLAMDRIIKIFQGEITLSDCMFRKKICTNRKVCVLRPEIKRIEKMVTKEFRKLTLAALLKKMK